MGEVYIANSNSTEDKVNALIGMYLEVAGNRDSRLFSEFLVKGYRQTTLESVPDIFFEEVIYAKVCLGMIITLYDDLADNPGMLRPQLLKELYQLNLDNLSLSVNLGKEDAKIYELAVHLLTELNKTIKNFFRYKNLLPVLIYDIKQIFLANQYSELMTSISEIRNQTESRQMGSYNMGMVAAGMIDLMASISFDFSELGKVRELLIRGQRIGRIGNLVSTFKREEQEGDQTNELLLHPKGHLVARNELLIEFHEGIATLLKDAKTVKSIAIEKYVEGLSSLFNLHQKMEGII